MPVIVNVGLSRKVSHDYQSCGYSLNIQAELPNGHIGDPNAMASATDELFRLANDLLDAQVKADTRGQPTAPVTVVAAEQRMNGVPLPTVRPQPASSSGKPYSNGNGHGSVRTKGRPLTEAQSKAIKVMAKKLGTEPNQIARDEFGMNSIAELDIKDASRMIDLLKERIGNEEVAGERR